MLSKNVLYYVDTTFQTYVGYPISNGPIINGYPNIITEEIGKLWIILSIKKCKGTEGTLHIYL